MSASGWMGVTGLGLDPMRFWLGQEMRGFCGFSREGVAVNERMVVGESINFH